MKESLQGMLGLFAQALAEDEAVKEYRLAREEYFSDTELVRSLAEYNAMKTAYDRELENEGDGEAKERLGTRVKELYDSITANARHERLSNAEDALNVLLNEINTTLMSAVTGSSCGGDCSGCAGCH